MKRLNQVKSMGKLLNLTKTRWQRLGSSITSLCVALGVTGLAGAPAMAVLESITGYGRYWNFDVDNNYNKVSSGYLNEVTRYKAEGGPCYGRTQTRNSCNFDSRTIATINGKRTEFLTAYGKYWKWEIVNSNTYTLLASGNLNDVTRYANGPCKDKPSGTCTFESLAIVTLGSRQIESVTAYGKYWNWDANTGELLPNGGDSLSNVTRYKDGPCHPTLTKGYPCKFDSREFFSIPGGYYESITAYGRYWNFDSTKNYQPIEGNAGGELTKVTRYGGNPCNGQAEGKCTFGTRAFY